MNAPISYSFTRYLTSKKSVDDRSLNKHVWNAMLEAIPPGTPASWLQILEIGAGVGTMIERALEWGLFDYAEYTALDAQEENINEIPKRLASWASEHDGLIKPLRGQVLLLQDAGKQVLVEPEIADIFDFIEKTQIKQWDLLIAHAFLDLVDISSALPPILKLVKPGGWVYFTLNFDGATLFEPQIDPVLDRQIEALYHRTMDERMINGKISGDSRSGRHLFERLRLAGCQVLASGSSDWVVYPDPGGYQQDEAYFLHFIIDTIFQALKGHPELEVETLQDWIAERHTQIERSELVYIAHQLDFFAQAAPPEIPSRRTVSD